MRKKIVAGNWKMNLNYAEAMSLVDFIVDNQDSSVGCEVILAPSFIFLHDIWTRVQRIHGISVAAQNCSDQVKGAFTGEVSASMLASIGVEYVIIGHSERRTQFNEFGKVISAKLVRVLENSLLPIYCCGETLEDRDAGNHFKKVKSQLESELFQLSNNQIIDSVIAYEPVWAIGTGRNATSDQAQEMHSFIRNEVMNKFGKDIAEQIPILYGGSVTSKNSAEIFSCKDVDGGLVGGASLKTEEFVSIIKNCKSKNQ